EVVGGSDGGHQLVVAGSLAELEAREATVAAEDEGLPAGQVATHPDAEQVVDRHCTEPTAELQLHCGAGIAIGGDHAGGDVRDAIAIESAQRDFAAECAGDLLLV